MVYKYRSMSTHPRTRYPLGLTGRRPRPREPHRRRSARGRTRTRTRTRRRPCPRTRRRSSARCVRVLNILASGFKSFGVFVNVFSRGFKSSGVFTWTAPSPERKGKDEDSDEVGPESVSSDSEEKQCALWRLRVFGSYSVQCQSCYW